MVFFSLRMKISISTKYQQIVQTPVIERHNMFCCLIMHLFKNEDKLKRQRNVIRIRIRSLTKGILPFDASVFDKHEICY